MQGSGNLPGIYLLTTVLWIPHFSYAQTQHFRVAALFEPEYEGMILSFQNAITKVNMHSEVGPGRNIIYDLKKIAPHDSFEANKEVCREMRAHGGIAAVFGPVSEISRAHVQSLCNAFEIPHIQAVWDARTPREYFSISVYPDHEELGKAFADLIKHWEWKVFTVIYEDGDSLIRLQKLLETARGEEYKMTVRRLESHQNTYKSLLKELKEKPEYRIVIDCHVSKIKQILQEADSLHMLSDYYHFHFTSLDLSQLDLDVYTNRGANITSMRLIDPSNPEVMNIMAEWGLMESNIGRSPLLGMRAVGTETALMYDAVHMYARALAGLANAHSISTEPLNCNKRESWRKGNSLLNYMKALEYDGLSGKIRFDDGKRKDFRLGVISLSTRGLIEIGNWYPKTGVNITVSFTQKIQDDKERLRNMTLRVVTLYDPPYVINLTKPNEKGQMHEGFIIDLLDELSAILGFKYTIYEQAQRGYGGEEDSGKWNGMIGDLIERDSVNKADVAAAGLTITYARARVVDFTMPFLNLGITIIYRKPVKTPPDLFSFLSPLSIDVWIYMLAAYLCVSFMLFVIARFTPYEWENPHPCNEDSEEVENQFTILNSLWFTIGSLMQQGCDIMPQAVSTRTVAILWWFFVLILVSSYTANLAAFLTMSRMAVPITNAEDLSKQHEIPYGTLRSGSTRNFFKVSNDVNPCNLFGLTEHETAFEYLIWPGMILLEGSDVAPKAGSTRFVASVWYLFTLILVSSYTANLAAFLTKSRMTSPINNADDLSLQTDIKYGTLTAGSTRDFFRNSNMTMYKRMNSYMTANEDRVMVGGNMEGFDRVKNKKYAFLAESTSIDYQVQRNCDLMQIGDLLDSKGYGIATPKDSPWIEFLSKEIVHLQQKQVISKIYTKWWVDKSDTVCVKEDTDKKDTNSLGVANVGGVFVVLAGGSIFGLLVSILEFLWKVGRNARADKQTFWSEMTEELRFIFVKCKSSRNTRSAKSVENNGVTFNAIPAVPNDRGHKEVID